MAFKEYKVIAEAQNPVCKLEMIKWLIIGNWILAWHTMLGIQAQRTAPTTSEQNGIAEHGFRVADSATCILARAEMSAPWGRGRSCL